MIRHGSKISWVVARFKYSLFSPQFFRGFMFRFDSCAYFSTGWQKTHQVYSGSPPSPLPAWVFPVCQPVEIILPQTMSGTSPRCAWPCVQPPWQRAACLGDGEGVVPHTHQRDQWLALLGQWLYPWTPSANEKWRYFTPQKIWVKL